ncbi:MAG: DUF6868 family protein [Thermodesulfobacteriota bacterium]
MKLEDNFLPKVIRMNKIEKNKIRGVGETMENNEYDFLLETVAMVLLRLFILGLGFLLLWIFLYLIAPDWIFKMNARWFDISKHDFDLINYCGIGFLKISILLFFLLPYLAIRSTLRRRGRKRST